jgi:hypothetical protein
MAGDIKTYKVKAHMNCRYELEVQAPNEEAALDIAGQNTDLSEWECLTDTYCDGELVIDKAEEV